MISSNRPGHKMHEIPDLLLKRSMAPGATPKLKGRRPGPRPSRRTHPVLPCRERRWSAVTGVKQHRDIWTAAWYIWDGLGERGGE